VGPERDWQKMVIDYAHLMGWHVAHFRTAQQGKRWVTPVGADGAGFPDLCLVRERILFAELKGPRGVLRPDQVVWLEKIRAAGVEAHVWKPKDWETVVKVLARNPIRTHVQEGIHG